MILCVGHCVYKKKAYKKLVRSKPLKNIIHMVSIRKRYEKASEKLPSWSFVALLLLPVIVMFRKNIHIALSVFSSVKFSLPKMDEIYGNFPSVVTAFLRHYALWQYFVMTSFSDGLLKTPRNRKWVENCRRYTLFSFSFHRT